MCLAGSCLEVFSEVLRHSQQVPIGTKNVSQNGGGKASANRNQEIGFGFVSCMRAKLCECVREVLSNAGVFDSKECDSLLGSLLIYLVKLQFVE